MKEVEDRLATNEAKKARELLETAMSTRQAFQIIKAQAVRDVMLGNPSSFSKIPDKIKDI